MWYRTGISWRHDRIVEGAALELVPPLGVMVFVPLAAVWVPVSLIYSFGADLDWIQGVCLALCGGVAPIAIAYAVITNRRWSRVLILATLAMNIWLYADGPSSGTAWLHVSGSWIFSAAVAGWLSIAVYLYRASKPRAYYLLLAGTPLPDELKRIDLAAPRLLVQMMAYVSYLSEWALILLALVLFFGLLLFADRL